jgi:hypothetical protein
MANVGYLEGTDPVVLTRLAARGVGTVPVSNGFDGHGKYINHLVSSDHIGVVVGHLHKLLPVPEREMTPRDLLFSCTTHGIGVLIVVPKAEQDAAKKLLGEAASQVTLVDPDDVFATVLKRMA